MNFLNAKKLWKILSYGHVPTCTSDFTYRSCCQSYSEKNIIEATRNTPSEEEPESDCPICLSTLGFSKLDDDKFKDFYIFDNMLFKCPQEKSILFHFGCVYRCANEATSNELKCPTCRKELNESVFNYMRGFVKHFINNPSDKLIETLQICMVNLEEEVISIFEEVNNIKKENCEKILILIKNLPYENIKKINQILRYKLLESEEVNISSVEFNNFCLKIENKPENICRIFDKYSNSIEKFNAFQVEKLIKKILSTNFADVLQEFEALSILFDLIPECVLKKFAEVSSEKCYILSTKFLRNNSVRGLELFTKLNKQPIEYDSSNISVIFDVLHPCYYGFSSKMIFYEAIKVIIYEQTSDNSLRKDLIKKLPYRLFLENRFDFLQNYFTNDDIFYITEDYLIEQHLLCNKSVDFLFNNELLSKYPKEINKMIGNFLLSSMFTYSLLFKSKLEYLITKLGENNLINNLKISVAISLFKSCIKYEVSTDSLKPFTVFIEKNLYKILILCEKIDIPLFFKLCNDLKEENKEDYEILDLSSKNFITRENLKTLCRIIKPKNIVSAFSKICLTSQLFKNYSLEDHDKLNVLITFVIQLPESKEMFYNFPNEFQYLIKLRMIELISSNFNCRTLQVEIEIEDYLHKMIKLTPNLEEKFENEDNFSIFSFLKPDYSSQENLEELKKILKYVSIDLLINFYRKLVSLH